MEPNNTPKQPVRPVNPAGAGVPPRPVAPKPTARPVAPRPASSTPASEPTKAGEPTFDNGPSVVGKKERKTGWILAIILLLIIAAGGVGFGVWAWMDGNTQRETLNNQINSLQQTNNDLMTQLDNANSTVSVDADGNEVDTADYIYVGEWGLKIKIPEDLVSVGYAVGYNSIGGQSVRVTGIKKPDTTGWVTPDFADIFKNVEGLGKVTRYQKGMEVVSSELIFSDDEYDYYYNYRDTQTAYYVDEGYDDESLANWESETTALIEDILTNAENYSKI